MTGTNRIYDRAAIRDLLHAAFEAEGLRRFCQDRPAFRPVLDDMGPDAGLNQIVDQLLP